MANDILSALGLSPQPAASPAVKKISYPKGEVVLTALACGMAFLVAIMPVFFIVVRKMDLFNWPKMVVVSVLWMIMAVLYGFLLILSRESRSARRFTAVAGLVVDGLALALQVFFIASWYGRYADWEIDQLILLLPIVILAGFATNAASIFTIMVSRVSKTDTSKDQQKNG